MVKTRGGKIPAPWVRSHSDRRLPGVNRRPPPKSDDSSTSSTYIPTESGSTSERTEFDQCTSPATTSATTAGDAAHFIGESSENMCHAVVTTFINLLKQADINALPHMHDAAQVVYTTIQKFGGDPSKLRDELEHTFGLCNKYLDMKRIFDLNLNNGEVYLLNDHIKALRPQVIASYAEIEPLEEKIEESKERAAQLDEMIRCLKKELEMLEKEKEELGDEILKIEAKLKEKVIALAEAPMVKTALETVLRQHKKAVLNQVNRIPDFK